MLSCMGISVMRKVDFLLLSRYRTQLMGIAALFIILCHANSYRVLLPSVIEKVLNFGNIGVDMFLFLSGFGCYYSLKNSKINTFKWILKRYRRIAIPYIVVQLVFLLYFIWLPNFSFADWLYEISTLSYWTNHLGCWYVAFLIPLYAITPPIFACLKEENKYRVVWLLFYLLVTIYLTNFMHNSIREDICIVCNVQMAFRRLPAFLLGMYMEPYIMNGRKIHLSILICFTIAGYLVFHILLPIYDWWLYVPFLLMGCCYLIRIIEKSIFGKLISWMGQASLESYITNVETKAVMPSILENLRYQTILVGNYLGYALVIVIGLILTYFCHCVCNQINKKFLIKL